MSNWKSIKVKDIGQLHNGRAFKPHEWSEQGLPIIRIQNLNGSQDFNYYEGTFEFKHEVNYEDLLFAWSGSRGTSFGPYIWKGDRSLLNQHIFKVELKENLDKFFIYYMLKRLTSEIEYNAHGSAGLVHITKKELEKFDILLPSLKEQQKIAEILSSVDAAIEKTEQVIAKTEEVKKGLMQQLLTKGIGHTEFKQTEIGEIPLTWDLVKLEEVTQLITKGTTPTTYGYKFEDNGVNFIKVENLRQSINSNELLKISYECHEKLQRSQLQIGDILFSIAGTLGSTYIVDESILPCNTNQALSIIRLKNNVNICYINYVLNSNLIQKEIDGLRTVGAQPNLNLKQVGNFTIPFPPIEEQDRISQIIKKNEEMVYNEIKKLRKLKSLKQGLMQQLLTGQVRVKID